MTAAVAASLPKADFLQSSKFITNPPASSFLHGSSGRLACHLKPTSKKRDLVSLVVASASTGTSGGGSERFYLNFTGFPFPLGPFLNRRTIRTEAVKDCIWLFEQEQALGFSSVSTNIRMTIIKLKSGGLWVHAPIAPTKECIQPPECISKESLLASAENGLAVKILSKGREVPQEPVIDNKLNRQKGWKRMVLQILFLGPSNLLEPTASFAQMSQKLIVSPIVKTLVFSKVPEKVRDWVDRITRDWPFRRIIPAHFLAPITANRSDFLAAFSFLDELLGERFVTRPSLSLLFASLMGRAASYFPPDDMKTLSSLDQFLVSVGVVKKTVSGKKQLKKFM